MNYTAIERNAPKVKFAITKNLTGKIRTLADSSPMRVRKPVDSWKPEDSWKLEYPDLHKKHPVGKRVFPRPRDFFDEMMDLDENVDNSSRFSTEVRSKYITYDDYAKPESLKHPSNLKLEGDLLTTTEKAEKFIEYLLIKRERLIKKPTTLKLIGDMEKKTENRDKFIPYEYQERPPLMKKSTNLHLEGERNITTENHDKFIEYKIQERQPLTKMSTNLHLDGDLDLHSEYRDVFVQYKIDKRNPTLPAHNLKLDGSYNIDTETKSKEFSHPPIPFLRGGDKQLILGDDRSEKYAEYKAKYVEYPKIQRSVMRRPESQLQQTGDMQTLTENKLQFVEKRSPKTERRRATNNLKLEGKIDMTPEYKNAYVDFYREGGRSPVKRRGGRGGNLRNEGDMDINPEYRSSFVNFPRERPHVKRPESQLANEGEMHHMTEKRAVYVQHPNYHKSEHLKRASELKLEGHFECQPEYRKAYVDYLIRERVERKPRPLDNLGTQQKRAFELVQGTDKPVDLNANKDANLSKKPEIKKEKPSTSGGTSQIPVAVKKPPASSSSDDTKKPPPSAKSTSSSSTTQKTSSKLPMRKKPPIPSSKYLTVSDSTSSRQSSRNVSPVPFSTSRRRSKSTTPRNKGKPLPRMESPEPRHHSRVGSRFSSPVRVEDLAYQPPVSPIPHILKDIPPPVHSRRRRSAIEDKAFVILDKEVNNNCACDDGHSLYKEQRWMSSWYNP